MTATKPETFWQTAKRKSLQCNVRQSVQLLRINKDYQIAHPQECKDNPECKQIAHPEAVKRIQKDLKLKTREAFQPPVTRPTRPNR